MVFVKVNNMAVRRANSVAPWLTCIDYNSDKIHWLFMSEINTIKMVDSIISNFKKEFNMTELAGYELFLLERKAELESQSNKEVAAAIKVHEGMAFEIKKKQYELDELKDKCEFKELLLALAKESRYVGNLSYLSMEYKIDGTNKVSSAQLRSFITNMSSNNDGTLNVRLPGLSTLVSSYNPVTNYSTYVKCVHGYCSSVYDWAVSVITREWTLY